MFEQLILSAHNDYMLTRFEEKNATRELPLCVRKNLDSKFFNWYYMYQILSFYIKKKGIEPRGKLRFGTIKIIPRRNHQIDARIDTTKNYYGWKVTCSRANGTHAVDILILLGTLTEAMLAFQESNKCRKK